MNKSKATIILILLAIFTVCKLASASDTAKEKRWASQITDSIMTGDATWLIAGKQRFLGIFTPAQTKKVLGGIIVIHGTGVHPNWSDIIQPLRTTLPDYGWATLAIQMPILKNDAKMKEYIPLFPEVTPRIKAAIKFLNTNNINNIVIISHSFGGQMAAYYLSQTPNNPIQAFVGIGMSSYKLDDKSNIFKALGKIKIPILDLYGSRDLDSVKNSAKLRAQAAKKAGNKKYFQAEVIGADHFFASMNDTLISKVKSWLNKNAPGVAIIKK